MRTRVAEDTAELECLNCYDIKLTYANEVS